MFFIGFIDWMNGKNKIKLTHMLCIWHKMATNEEIDDLSTIKTEKENEGRN